MKGHLVDLSRLVEKEIQQYTFPQKPTNLYDPLRYIMTLGGKRIRPVLTLLGAELFSTPANDAMHAAISVELFHNFTLIHDDIMDEAPLRRGMETVHTKWDQNIAILSGDVLMIKAIQELAKQKPEHVLELLNLFNRTAAEVCDGQQMDMDFEKREDVSIPEYIEMIRLKTSVLLGCALEMGAIIGNASEQDRKLMYQFGQQIGLAFQIKDDILDLYGDPEKFGKQIGGDVISNKKTLLYLTALKDANEAQKIEFLGLEKESNLDKKVDGVKTLFNTLNIREKVSIIMEIHRKYAMEALAAISIEESQKENLRALATYLMEREN